MRRFVLIAALAAAACDHPPVKEIASAEQQVERARAAGAERYAPERWTQPEAALALARQRLESRDYQSALSASNDAVESARLAIEAIGPAKAAARRAAEDAVAEVRTVLERATAERAAAVKAGVSRKALAGMDARSQEASLQLAAVSHKLEAGSLDEVAAMTEALRTLVTPLPDAYRAARAGLEARRPRGRAARRPRG